MIDKRLIGTVKESKKYITYNVALQWFSLIANIAMMISICTLLERLYLKTSDNSLFITVFFITVAAIIIRFICTNQANKMSYLSSKTVKKTLRKMIYEKLLKIGTSYKEKINTSEIVQVAVEGVEQLETYFGAYLPQFFYSMLAPLTLFIVLSFISFKASIILIICVPLIPVSIAVVQTWAKKLLSKYWGQYTALGDTFLENLQGLTTLKIYQADEFKNKEMNEEAEKFRKITMKVLTMQLNSITIMDLIAYGGAALGVIIAANEYGKGNISLSGCLLIILLAADFFIPMRLLGSFFHIAMNGMAASDKIFRFLDLEETQNIGTENFPKKFNITCQNVSFSYNSEREILHNINLIFPKNKFTAIVGESGCGKSTITSLLTGKNKNYSGNIFIGNTELKNIKEEKLTKNITYINNNSYIFKGDVKQNLLMGKPDATDQELWEVLEKAKLAEFLKTENGLETILEEKGANFSGGQCQRLALARALLHDSPIYIFDEATSNIDAESENDIMEQIHFLTQTKTVILISHRLANTVKADNIYVIENGNIVENGTHNELLNNNSVYYKLWNIQKNLENYQKEV